MLKPKEHSQQILVSQLNAEKRARRAAEKKAHDADLRVSDLTNRNTELESRLEVQLNKVSEMVQQIAAMLMGNGALSLSDSLKEELIGTIRLEFERQTQELKEMHEKEKRELIASFNAKLAAKDNEIARLRGEKGKDNGSSPSTTISNNSDSLSPEELASRNKQLEQQKTNLQVASYGQHGQTTQGQEGYKET